MVKVGFSVGFVLVKYLLSLFLKVLREIYFRLLSVKKKIVKQFILSDFLRITGNH